MKHSELTFQLIVESVPNAIVLVNKEGRIAYLNSQSEELFGYKRAELIGREVELLIPKRYHQNHSGFRNMFFAEPTVRAMGAGRELFASRKDGSEFPIEIGLNPIVTMDGILVLASIIDISERKRAEERFRLVVESGPNAMVLVNDTGVITLVNMQAERLFGYNRLEMIGKKIEMLLPERYGAMHPGHRETFFSKPQTRAMGMGRELFAMRKDGSEVQVEIGLNPIETTEGVMVLASITDITERKLQEATRKRHLELEIKNKELEQFAYIASHDLQEPLRTVSNYVQLLEEDFAAELDESARKYLSTIHRATKRMSVLIKALLDFSRLGRDRVITLVDLDKVMEDTMADMEWMIKASKAQITVDPLPTVMGSGTEMRQLFQNLISNAIKFSKSGTDPQVHVRCTEKERMWQLSISDNGIGIVPEHYERIFQIFTRLNTTEEYEGYGIGLANCKKIVELHEGEISIDSALGIGTTIHFTLPIHH